MNILILHFFQYLLKHGGYSRRGGVLLWKEIESKSILEDRSWRAIQGRFLKHTMGNLKEFKVTEDKLVAADEKAKAKGSNRDRHYYQASEAHRNRWITVP